MALSPKHQRPADEGSKAERRPYANALGESDEFLELELERPCLKVLQRLGAEDYVNQAIRDKSARLGLHNPKR